MPSTAAPVVVTGANGLVGSRICEGLVERGASVRAVVRRGGTASGLPGVVEVVGDFTDPDLATRVVPDAADPASGPVSRACISLNVAAARATQRDYFEAVTGALGVDPAWEEVPSWTGRLLTDRAHDWGWIPTVDLAQALAEIVTGLSVRL